MELGLTDMISMHFLSLNRKAVAPGYHWKEWTPEKVREYVLIHVVLCDFDHPAGATSLHQNGKNPCQNREIKDQ